MTGLDISPEALETEKRVDIEEYKQRYLNQPYGDQGMLLRSLAYTLHPYRWATIGLTPDHVARATLDEVRAFYRRWYHPSNAILSVSADIDEERVFELAERYFAPIADTPSAAGPLPAEPEQTAERRLEVERGRTGHGGDGRLPHERPPFAGFLSGRHGLRHPVGRRFGTALRTARQARPALFERQRLHHGRRRSGAFRPHGAPAAGTHRRGGRSGLRPRNRGAANPPRRATTRSKR